MKGYVRKDYYGIQTLQNPKAKNSTVLGTIRTFAKRAKTEKR